MVRVGGWVAAALLLLPSATAARAQALPPTAGPRGPVLGDNGFRSAIRDDGAPDVDDYVGPLAAGETLSVEVRAAAGGTLRPSLALFDPEGADRTPPLRESADGAVVSLRRFAADRTGRWVLRVLGREDSEGAYEVRFRVGSPPGPRAQRRRLAPGGAPRIESVPFEAIRGSILDLRMGPAGDSPLPPSLSLIDPSGRPIPALAGLLERRGSGWALRRIPLDGPDGTWRLEVPAGGDSPTRPVDLSLRVTPPRRPRGIADLDPFEPSLPPRDGPLSAAAGSLVRLPGSGFSEAPLPVALLGGTPLQVLAVGDGGDSISLLLPAAPTKEALEITVINRDGQACSRPGYVRVLPPGPPVALSLDPVPILLAAGETRTVTVALSGPAPVAGATVALFLEGGVASGPASVRVPPYGVEASFEVTAGKKPGSGRLLATYGTTLDSPVEVAPSPGPMEIDLSGWRLVQTDSARTFTFPAGTRLPRGASFVLARNDPRPSFESFWGALLPTDALYADSGDKFPSLNGDETFTLLDSAGTIVDGPTPRLVAGRLWRRRPGSPAGLATSWDDRAAVPGAATPGLSEGGVDDGVVRITEIADPPAAGQFVHEFVEVSWDRF